MTVKLRGPASSELEVLCFKRIWSHPPGLNRRPADYESAALPTELGWLVVLMITTGSEFSQSESIGGEASLSILPPILSHLESPLAPCYPGSLPGIGGPSHVSRATDCRTAGTGARCHRQGFGTAKRGAVWRLSREVSQRENLPGGHARAGIVRELLLVPGLRRQHSGHLQAH